MTMRDTTCKLVMLLHLPTTMTNSTAIFYL